MYKDRRSGLLARFWQCETFFVKQFMNNFLSAHCRADKYHGKKLEV